MADEGSAKVVRLNGWQRLWLVGSAIWLMPFALALFAIGLPPVFTPPRMEQWTMSCSLEPVVERLLADGEAEPDIAAIIAAAKDGIVKVSFWRPEGDKGPTPTLDCTKAGLIFNPVTKRKQLKVHAKFENAIYGTYFTGYDLDSATSLEIQERVARSQEDRRELVLGGFAFAFGLPALLYACGVAVAWVRRGFREDRSTPDNSMKT